MRRFKGAGRPAAAFCLSAGLLASWSVGCGFDLGSANLLNWVPFTDRNTTGRGGTGGDDGDSDGDDPFAGGGSGTEDPCDETNNRKFITISMQNQAQDHVHYFLVLVAQVQTADQDGGVCEDDVDLYTDFGYTFVGEGGALAFGNYCVVGPALLYFHEQGSFQGTSGLASGIAPAQGNNPSFDAFFTGAGARVPIPDTILFHNPGTGEGAALQVAALDPDPCGNSDTFNLPGVCNLDSFYYVDDNDLLAGSTATGSGSGRRIPSEIQDTGCASGFSFAGQSLAAPGTTASSSADFEYFRGGRIEYVFLRDDQNPPIPQLLWRVTDENGSLIHDFDPRASVD